MHSIRQLILQTSLSISLMLGTLGALQAEAINIIEERAKLEALKNSENDLGEEQYKDRYRIELLLFAYVNTGEENSEIWRNPPRPSFEGLSPAYVNKQGNYSTESLLTQPQTDSSSSEMPSLYNFIKLSEDDDNDPSEFRDILRKMKINGHYRTLQHLMWEQQVLEQENSPLFYLEGGDYYPSKQDLLNQQQEQMVAEANSAQSTTANEQVEQGDQSEPLPGTPELAGTLHIYRARYLHVKPDLWFTEFSPNDVGTCPVDQIPENIEQDMQQSLPQGFTALTNFHISQHRRLRSGELHYIDHPRFGLLIKFTRLEAPEPEAELNNGNEAEPGTEETL